MIRRIALALILLAAPMAAAAGARDKPIPLEEWRSMTDGRTVYYYIDGVFFGREHYWPGTNMVTFQHASGLCADAHWTYRNGIYCFHFDRPHCFAHVHRAGRIVIIPDNVEPDETAQEQEVRLISPAPFSCQPGAMS
ncbi:MAG: hypothetical protein D6754_15175 [Alphaproteobacteria bacterium]|nr:MAG: hypothetical protein D6754_15175 [Alphaproteobacteria bacterium]